MPEFKVGDRVKVIRCIKWPGDESFQPIHDARNPEYRTRVFTVLEVEAPRLRIKDPTCIFSDMEVGAGRIRVKDSWCDWPQREAGGWSRNRTLWLELDYFQIEHE